MICNVCGEELHYCSYHDSLYCAHCDEWKEPKCSDPDCEFCKDREAKLSMCENLLVDRWKDAIHIEIE
jgi:hypothetical protein